MIPALALLAPFVPSIVQMVEKLFNKSDSGSDKMAAAKAMLDQLAAHLASTKLIDEKPGPDALAGIIEASLSQLKASNTLTAPTTGKIYLVRGSIQEIAI